VKQLSGLEVTLDEMLKILKGLGFECQRSVTASKAEALSTAKGKQSSQISVFVPYWRSDIKYAVDLVEEVTRIIGYDKVPVTRLSSPLPAQESTLSLREQRNNLKRKLRNTLTGWGFQ